MAKRITEILGKFWNATIVGLTWVFCDGWLKRIVGTVVVLGVLVWWQWDRFTNIIEPRTNKPVAVIKIAGTENPNRRGDVIFVHGLGASAITNWENETNPEFFWPKWLHEESNDLGIWSLDYDAYPSKWLGGSMPLEVQAEYLLEAMRLNGLGKKPIIFVCHSLGGIVTKQIICDVHSGKLDETGKPIYEPFERNIKGVVFLATPHTGSEKATLLNLTKMLGVRTTVTVAELESDNAKLLKLARDYRDGVGKWRIQNRILYETRETAPWGRIVPDGSADPGIPGAIITGLPENHLSICRLAHKDHLVCKSVSEFISTYLKPLPVKNDTTIADLIAQFGKVRLDGAQLELFKKKYEHQQFTWKVFVKSVIPASTPSSRPGYYVQAALKPGNLWEPVFLRFTYPEEDGFELKMLANTQLEITGVFDPGATALNGIVLSDARVIKVLASPPEE